MNLYEINSALQAAVDDCIDPETGEILDESLLDAIDELQMTRDEKIENLCLYIKNLRSDADQLKAEKQAFAKRQAAAEAKADRLTRYLSDVLAGEKWKAADGRAAISYRKTASVPSPTWHRFRQPSHGSPIRFRIRQPSKSRSRTGRMYPARRSLPGIASRSGDAYEHL